MKINDRKKILCDWPPLQVPWIRWNWSQVLKPRMFRENVDHRIRHKFPAWKLTIERKSHVIGHPYRFLDSKELVPGPEASPVSRKRWPQKCTQISSMKINHIKKILCDWPPLHIPSVRWTWSQVLKPRLIRENVDHIIGRKFPALKLTIERKSHVIGHPYRSPLFDGSGPRSWNLACFEKTLTTEMHTNSQHEN